MHAVWGGTAKSTTGTSLLAAALHRWRIAYKWRIVPLLSRYSSRRQFFDFCFSIISLESLSRLNGACQRRNLQTWLGEHGWVGTGGWSVSGLLLGASFYHYSQDRYHCKAALHGGRVATGPWVLIGG